VLSTEQKNILNTIDLGTELVVDVTYTYKNSVTEDIQIHQMHTAVTVVPDKEAEYIGGYEQLTKYLRENGVPKFLALSADAYRQIAVEFTVNEIGAVVNTKISRTSGDSKIDRLFLETMNKMPKWKPAENSTGMPVKQEFQISTGESREGC
jgi:TonB family protein